MEFSEAEAAVARYTTEIDDLREVAAAALERAAALSQIVRGCLALYPVLEDQVPSQRLLPEAQPSTDTAPRGLQAVRVVLQEKPNYWWYITEIVAALGERRWLPESDNPANAVRAACERLLNTDGSDLHKGRGTSGKVAYAYRPDDEPWDGGTVQFSDDEPY